MKRNEINIKSTSEKNNKESFSKKEYWIKRIDEKFSGLSKKNKLDKHNKFLEDFKNAPLNIKTDEDIVLLALSKYKLHIKDVDESLVNNKSFILKYIENNDYISFSSLPKEMKLDEEVFLKCYKKDYNVFMYSSWISNKFTNKDTIVKLLKINSTLIKELSNTYKDDIEIAKIVINQNPENIQYLNKRTTYKIFNTPESTIELLENNNNLFEYISPKLRTDPKFVIHHIRKNPWLLRSIPPKLAGNKRFVENLLYNPFFNVYISSLFKSFKDDIKTDENLMLKIIRANGLAIFYINDRLKNEDFYMKSVEVNPNVYFHLNEKLMINHNIIHSFLKHEYIVRDFKKTPTIKVLPNSIVKECENEFYELSKNKETLSTGLTLEKYITDKYLNLYLNDKLKKSNNRFRSNNKL